MLRTICAVLVALLAPTAALAETCLAPGPNFELSKADVSRLQNLEVSRERGLTAAQVYDLSEEGNLIAALFAEGLEPPDPTSLAGDYRCRTIKLGGISPRTVYDWFQCRITAAGPGFSVEKLTGSQNFSGDLITVEGGYILRGAGHYGDEAPRAYGVNPERDEVGCLMQVWGDPRHLVLELPEPKLESFHDVIELEPR